MRDDIEKVKQGVDAILCIVASIEMVIENGYNVWSIRNLWKSVRKLKKTTFVRSMIETYQALNDKEKQVVIAYAMDSFRLDSQRAEEAIRESVYIWNRLKNLRHILWIAKNRVRK